jgi:DNA polymerase III subunit delta'
MARAPTLTETEDVPEVDRLEGVPHPRQTERVFGHDAAATGFAATFASGRMHHGWLITGGDGIGKATFAYACARYLLARPDQRDQGDTPLDIAAETTAARQVRALSHPGLLVLRRPYDAKTKKFAASILVDEVRRLREFLGLTAGEAQWRVVLVDTADDLNTNAANAILKWLEEPPARTIFLLLSAEPGRLLPTIRSRCRTLALAPLGSVDLRRAVIQATAAGEIEPPGAQDWPRLERIAGGSVRRALVLASGGGLKLHEKIEDLLGRLPAVDWAGVHALSDELAGQAADARFAMFYDLLLRRLAHLIRARASGSADDATLTQDLIPDAARLPRWADGLAALTGELNEAITLNLDRKALILATVQRLEGLARG